MKTATDEMDDILESINGQLFDLKRKISGIAGDEAGEGDGDLLGSEHIKAFTDGMREMVIVASSVDGRILYANRRAGKTLGYGPKEILGARLTDIDTSLPGSLAWKNHLERLAGGAVTREARFRARGGRVVAVEVSTQLRTIRGIAYVVAVARDILERKRAEEDSARHKVRLEGLIEERTAELIDANRRLQHEITCNRKAQRALAESEERYRSLFTESKDVVYIRDPAGRFLDINPAGAELFGYSSAEEMLSLNIRDVYSDSRGMEQFEREIEEKGYVADFEAVMRKKDGTEITVNLTGNAVKDRWGNAIAYRAILRDITRSKELERQLLHAQKMEALGQLTGGIAHDFNNMLMAIMMYTESMQMLTTEDDPLKACIDQVKGVTEKAAGLTRRLLAFSRKQMMCLEGLDINDTVRSMEKLLARVIGEDIELKTDLAPEALTVMADNGQIEQVLVNLATNARDAMAGGGTLAISTSLEDSPGTAPIGREDGAPASWACISVTDNGTGMDEETARKVYDPFFTTKEVGKGTGLGLSVVYGIIEQHRGRITIDSSPGKGTTIKVYIPFSEVRVGAVTKGGGEACPHGTETVLLAEDDPEVREITTRVLEDFGYRVIAATDGADAVARFRANRDGISMLILDVIMPRMNGRESLEEIRRLDPGVKAVFLSGYTEDVMLHKGVLDGDYRFISKPVVPAELLKIIRDVLAEDNRPSGAAV